MIFDDLINIYESKKSQYGKQTYLYISRILQEAKEKHRKDFMGSDHERSWHSFKSKNIGKLVEYIIKCEVPSLGLKVINGNRLKYTRGDTLPKELGQVKRKLLIDYGEYGYYLPDVDLVIYNPKNIEILVVLTSKSILRKEITQMDNWRIKLATDKVTKYIKVFFVTPNANKKMIKMEYSITNVNIDRSYVLSEKRIEENNNVKMFDKIISDIKELIEYK